MPRVTRRAGSIVLFALLTCLATVAVPGCGGQKPTRQQAIERYSDELREAVSSEVPDQPRRDQMLSIVDQLKAVHLRFSQDTVDFIESYRKVNADYDSTRTAFNELFADYRAKRVKARGEAIALHFQLASLATASEWDTLGKAETKLYDQAYEAPVAKEGAK
jgi:hypothetical protein